LLRRPPLIRWRALRTGSATGFASATDGNDIPVCIRPTGGGLVEHGNDLIYSVIARRDSFPTFHQVRTSYLSFHEAVQEAFQKLGVETRLVRCDDFRRRRGRVTDCFNQPVATDVLFKGVKIAGGAQWRRGEAFLHQGSIQLTPGISFEGLKEALIEAFAGQFDIAWSDRMIESVGGH
jgi:lipoate-protein ligase A